MLRDAKRGVHPARRKIVARMPLRPRDARAQPGCCQPSHQRGRAGRGFRTRKPGNRANRTLRLEGRLLGAPHRHIRRCSRLPHPCIYRTAMKTPHSGLGSLGDIRRRVAQDLHRVAALSVVKSALEPVALTHANQFGDGSASQTRLRAANHAMVTIGPSLAPCPALPGGVRGDDAGRRSRPRCRSLRQRPMT